MGMTLRDKLRVVPTLARTYGIVGGVVRVGLELRRATGLFRSSPVHPIWVSRSGLNAFTVDPTKLLDSIDSQRAIARAERVLGGHFQAFRSGWRSLPSSPAEWLCNPSTGVSYDRESAWWSVETFSPRKGDIKQLWAPARFSWAFDLVRAHLITGDPRFRDGFDRHFDGWFDSSPPFRGPHWACGQETAIRAVALLYAEANFSSQGSAKWRNSRVEQVLAWSGERIADAMAYAVSQRNNHVISEAAALIVLGVRFRGAHPEAERWLKRGTKQLERAVSHQFAEDGWYIQHSVWYMRLALDQCVIAQRALAQVDQSLAAGAIDRLRRAFDILVLLTCRGADVPNHGPNDGSFVHPITLAPYASFGPTLTAVACTFGLSLPQGIQLDCEVAAWLSTPLPQVGLRIADGVYQGTSGWVVAIVGDTRVFLRAGSYQSRPGHSDSLQLDISFGGRCAVADPGTYAYNAPAPWDNGLRVARVHNGPLLDDRDPAVPGPRFLWFGWPEASVKAAVWNGTEVVIEAVRQGEVRRVVRVRENGVEVLDKALNPSADEIIVRWLLHPEARLSSVQVDGNFTVVEAKKGQVLGWYSPTYDVRVKSRVVEVRRKSSDGLKIRTMVNPN